MLNAWNKSSVIIPDFSNNCDQSKHVILGKKCAHESFGHKNRGGRGLCQLDNRNKMSELFVRANIFPSKDGNIQRVFHPNFFLDLVQRPTNVGSKKDKSLEKRDLTVSKKFLHDRLCKGDDRVDDYDDFDLDEEDHDDVALNTSSVFARDDDDACTANVDEEDGVEMGVDWENLNEEDRDGRIKDTLKHMGNVKKRKMSNIIMLDMLGADGLKSLKKVKKSHQQKLAKARRKIDLIYTAVRYFEVRMKKRRAFLADNIKKSKKKTYSTLSPTWKTAYETIKHSRY